MLKIKLKRNHTLNIGKSFVKYKVGDEVFLPDYIANEYVKSGIAEKIELQPEPIFESIHSDIVLERETENTEIEI